MNEHEKAVKAAQQVQKITAFYIHLGGFLLVIGLLLVVNWFATPDVWWVQWPFLGWGLAVLGHALCAFGAMPNYVRAWQLRKTKELSDRQVPGGGGSIATTIGIIVLAMMIGGAAGAGYMYVQLQGALEKVAIADAARETLSETVKTQEEQLKKAQAAKDAAEKALAEAKKGTPQ